MLSVILIILKIIGIALLVLLGILLFLILIVLFVPIRYRVKVEHGDAFTLEGGISWLLHLVHARISLSDGKRRIWVRILGILVFDSLRPTKVRRVRSVRKKNKADSTLKTEIISKEEIISKDIMKEDVTQEKTEPNIFEEDSIYEEKSVNDDITKDKLENDEEEHDNGKFIEKLIKRFKDFKAKIVNFFIGIKTKIKELVHKLLNIKDKAGLILNFITDDINKRGFRLTYETLKKVLKHILPRKLRSRLIFGTGDPCSTGQALGIFGILYSLYGNSIQVTPDFENKVFKGSHYVRGRIRSWTLFIIVIKLLFDKRFKDLKMNFQLLKEAL